MPLPISGSVGLQRKVGDGTNPLLAQGYQGEGLFSEVQGRYYQLTKAGWLFHAMSANVTVVAANVSPLASGTGQPILGFLNPASSGVDCVIKKVGAVTVSGTPGGPLIWNFGPASAITASQNSTPHSGNLGGGGKVQIIANAALTGGPLLTALRDACNISAVAAGANTGPLMEDTGGDIIVPPGFIACLAALAVGTSHVVRASATYAEVAS